MKRHAYCMHALWKVPLSEIDWGLISVPLHLNKRKIIFPCLLMFTKLMFIPSLRWYTPNSTVRSRTFRLPGTHGCFRWKVACSNFNEMLDGNVPHRLVNADSITSVLPQNLSQRLKSLLKYSGLLINIKVILIDQRLCAASVWQPMSFVKLFQTNPNLN